MRIWHGTTVRRWKRIQEAGVIAGSSLKIRQNWRVSGDYVYFWTEDFVRSERGAATTDAELLQAALVRAAESAHFALADEEIGDDFRVVVIEMNTDDLEKEGIVVEPDESCNNMLGAVQVSEPIPARLIRQVHIHRDNLSAAKPLFVQFRLSRLRDAEGLAKDFSLVPDDLTLSMAKILGDDVSGFGICRLHELLYECAADPENWTTEDRSTWRCRPRRASLSRGMERQAER